MDSEARTDEKISDDQTTTRSSSENEVSILRDAQLLWDELRALSHDHFKLAVLEAQLASKSLIIMIVAGVMVGILLSSAWIGLVAAIVVTLAEYGVLENNAILILFTVAFNLMLVLILCRVISRKSHDLRFPATLRNLQPEQSARQNIGET